MPCDASCAAEDWPRLRASAANAVVPVPVAPVVPASCRAVVPVPVPSLPVPVVPVSCRAVVPVVPVVARAVGSKTDSRAFDREELLQRRCRARAHTHTVVSLTVTCAWHARDGKGGARSQSGLANGHVRRKEAARASRIAPMKFARGSSPRSRPELIFLSVCTAALVLRQMWQG